MRCPVCKKLVLDRTSESAPFCSPRCQLIDLGRWAAEDYYIPGKTVFLEDEEIEYQAMPEPEDQGSSFRKHSI